MDMGRTSRPWSRPTITDTEGSRVPRHLLSKRQLEIKLAQTAIFDSPNLSLEQYPVSPEAGAELLYMAGFEHDDILDREVVDLGTGTGRLALGAVFLGAKKVVGVDVDPASIKLAKKNEIMFGAKVDWMIGRVEDAAGRFDTVVMNPPYGTREEHADTRFLEAAFRIAPTVYSIHKSSTRAYLTRFVEAHNRTVDMVRTMPMQLPHLFSFHRKKWKSVEIDLYRITRSDP